MGWLEDRRHLKPIFVGLYQRRDDCGPATCILETDKMTCHDRYREVWSATKRGYAAAASARFEHGQSGRSLTSSARSSACFGRALQPGGRLRGALMTDFAIGEVVKLKSGGHEMTVQEITEDGAKFIWSEGKRVRSESFHPTLLILRDPPVTRIERLIVYPDRDIEEIVAEMRHASKAQDDIGFHVEDETARAILKRHLGPQPD
jgi:uncharacterized protein YodC (DUF2158 family)